MSFTQRYLIYISYLGTNFRGSQIQRDNVGSTVQGVLVTLLNGIFKNLTKQSIKITLTSRTDSGVHALRTAVQTDLPPLKGQFISPDLLKDVLNTKLGKSEHNLRVLESQWVPDIFNVRRSTKEKVYIYRVAIPKRDADLSRRLIPISEIDRTFFLSNVSNFNPDKVHQALQLFIGEKDFSTFVGRLSKNTRITICNISSFKFEHTYALMPGLDAVSDKYDYYQFVCCGNRFLYRMVRRMVGVLLSVGFNQVSLEDVQLMFDKPGSVSWPVKSCVAPAFGLYLADVFYTPEHLILTNEEIEKIKAYREPTETEVKREPCVPYSGLNKFYESLEQINNHSDH